MAVAPVEVEVVALDAAADGGVGVDHQVAVDLFDVLDAGERPPRKLVEGFPPRSVPARLLPVPT